MWHTIEGLFQLNGSPRIGQCLMQDDRDQSPLSCMEAISSDSETYPAWLSARPFQTHEQALQRPLDPTLWVYDDRVAILFTEEAALWIALFKAVR